MNTSSQNEIFDIFIIGGGVNGCGIARDAAGRGLSVYLAEQDDLASGTSSSSSKLIHGGLRYLEYFDFRLVQESLKERDVLLKMMPHISWPMRFVMPHDPNLQYSGNSPITKLSNTFMPWLNKKRPAWMMRMGLQVYDFMGHSDLLPKVRKIDLRSDEVGSNLKNEFTVAFEYSDCWVDDARLVVLNAMDARDKGAVIKTHTKVIQAKRKDKYWEVKTKNTITSQEETIKAKLLINASGAWVNNVAEKLDCDNYSKNLRLVKGSHIVVNKLYKHDRSYILPGIDGRIIFVIPYENDYTLIGTTEVDQDQPEKIDCSDEEVDYLINCVSHYFEQEIIKEEVVWTYSGVRPLFGSDDANASSVSRDYTLKLENKNNLVLLNIYGGKITTYRKLAEAVLDKISDYFPQMKKPWTANSSLPGGNFAIDDLNNLYNIVKKENLFLADDNIKRLIRLYGTNAQNIFANLNSKEELGEEFGAGLFEVEVKWLIDNEFAISVDDIIWRRTKLGLKLNKKQINNLDNWINNYLVNKD